MSKLLNKQRCAGNKIIKGLLNIIFKFNYLRNKLVYLTFFLIDLRNKLSKRFYRIKIN